MIISAEEKNDFLSFYIKRDSGVQISNMIYNQCFYSKQCSNGDGYRDNFLLPFFTGSLDSRNYACLIETLLKSTEKL